MIYNLHIHSISRQFILFCSVGAINTTLSLIIILLLLEWIGLHYMAANLFGYIIGLLIAFFLHSRITFKISSNAFRISFKRLRCFVVVFVISYLSQLIFLYTFVDILKWDTALSQIIAVGIYTCLNFAGNKWWTFANHQDGKDK